MSDFDPMSTPPIDPVPTSQDERTWVIITRFSPLATFVIPFANIIAPLVIWLIKRDQMPAVDQHAKEVLNFQITILLIMVAAFVVLLITVIGVILIPLVLPAIGLYWLVMTILSGIEAANGKFRRYPLTWRVIK
jgi:uncharacterized Tic20 family protein